MAKKVKVRYESVNVTSLTGEVKETPVLGEFKKTGEKDFEFCRNQMNIFSRDAEARWQRVRYSKSLGRRMTRNSSTGDYRVTYTIKHEQIKELTRRRMATLADDFQDMLDEIIENETKE